LGPGWINGLSPHLQNNQSKMDWNCGSSDRTSALQVQSPEFKPQSHKRKKERMKKRKKERPSNRKRKEKKVLENTLGERKLKSKGNSFGGEI
jgi:hypothetical protein